MLGDQQLVRDLKQQLADSTDTISTHRTEYEQRISLLMEESTALRATVKQLNNQLMQAGVVYESKLQECEQMY